MGAALAGALALAATGGSLTVGSKQFGESLVLGELAVELARDAGVPAEHRAALGGTRVVWEALVRGDVDLYPEYTGTVARELLGGAVPAGDPAALRAALAARGVGMTRSLGFEDTYALGMRRARAAELGISRVSDLARSPRLRLGFTNEFMDRGDGWPALRARYRLPQRDVRGLEHEVAYTALAGGEIDVTDLYSTDPEIRRHDLVVLEDDLHAFPPYDAVYLYRLDLERRAPAALEAIRRLEGRIDAAAMIALNARAELDGVAPARVASEFLRATLGVAAAPEEEGRTARVLRRTREHVALVAVALLAAIALAVPLGVVAARRPGVGRVVLAAVGVVQTVPSLALLVMMIPLLGIGARPAVAALFLYGLLPIVRNTHAGLTGIPLELRESAAALGLPPGARLRLVELPLASPAILAGVKTSAVIAVGTATLGALVGAGGYGQPILTGVRLASVPLILEGAIPAALLALAAQALFDLAERWLVPRGLRRARAAGAIR
ncbi:MULTISPECIES: glycine betaine ABC transporter substrate-binding protein [unclassified Anaeromyxobacter]|uniref:ABC transporter permease/substrate-binding protein n=1 Tax=unclassified Anaeromyxobacter TaxID=2620896 RepID=UPI001F5A73C9|nr:MULTISPECIES: glycine betaine ABC transporter substrate-binding protein [unclassified Anaeromyxobacter]